MDHRVLVRLVDQIVRYLHEHQDDSQVQLQIGISHQENQHITEYPTPQNEERKREGHSRNAKQLSSFSNQQQYLVEKVRRISPRRDEEEEQIKQGSPKEKINDNLKRINSEIHKFQSKLKEYNK